MNDSLKDAEVLQITALIESLDRSSLDFLQIDAGGVKVTISKGGAGPAPTPALAAPAAVAPAPVPAAPQVVAGPAGGGPGAAPERAPAPTAAGAHDATVAITAPLLGRFYSKPDPGSPPFVTLGGVVDLDTPVGLIEVMKLFNTVPAGVRGTIVEVCVADGEFIEYGTPIFRVRPADPGAAGGN